MRQTPEVNDKPDNFLDNWKKLIKYSNKYWMALFASVFLAAGGNILNVLAPYQMGRMTDVIEAGIGAVLDMDAIMSIGLILVFLYGMGGLFNLIQGWIMAGVTQRISEDLRSDISTKINKLPMSYFSNTTVGDTLSRVTNDVDTIGRALNMSVQNLISAITMLVGSFIMMLITNVTLTFTAVASSAIGLLLMTLIMSRSQKYFVAQQNHLGAVNGLVEETYSGHMIVKSYNAEALVRNDFTTMNEDLRSSGFKAQALSSLMMPIMTFVGNLGYLAVCVVGAALALNGSIPFGVIVVFILYVRLFTQPLSQIAQSFQALQSAAAAGERVFDMLEADEMEDETNKTLQIDTIKGEVEFKHVNFSYEDSPEPVIKDFSAVAKPGQKIAIVGHTGAGKTTIVNLLMRFYEIDSGVITIDGTSIQNLPKDT